MAVHLMTGKRLRNPNGRSTAEWVASSPDAAIPPRVIIRIVERHDKRCAECGRLLGGKLGCEIDHKLALSNGGTHREGNLRPLCTECHKPKTAADRKIKAKADRLIKRQLGLKRPKFRGWRKMDGTPVWANQK